MTKKRRNNGRNKPSGARGRVKRVRCESSGVLVPKDKAVKRFIVRNIVDASAIRDIQDSSAIDSYALPKIYRKVYYSISAAIHSKIVRVRSRRDRYNREPPPRYRPAPADRDRQPRQAWGAGGGPPAGGGGPPYGGGGGGYGGGYGGGGGGYGGGGARPDAYRTPTKTDGPFGGVPPTASPPLAPPTPGADWGDTAVKDAGGAGWA